MPMNQEESAFKRRYKAIAKKYDLDPNPDSPEHHYDYRANYRANPTKFGPDSSGHWDSRFKKDTHQNLIVNGYNTKTGEKVT